MTTSGGYFSAPSASLDPHLFDGDVLRAEVRSFILKTIYGVIRDYGLANPKRWLSIWITGSGASYQWGNGDLDIILGVDYTKFSRYNPEYAGIDYDAAANDLNRYLKKNLWKLTSAVNFGGSTYEATFYWDAAAGTDIERIKPYAAYDVLSGSWIVPPFKLPASPSELYSPQWYEAADRDRSSADEVLSRYRAFSRQFSNAVPGTPKYHNAGNALNLAKSQAKALFDDIHLGRHQAFAEQGHGYRDFHNFRWQRAKATRVVDDLRKVVDEAKLSDDSRDAVLYGGAISGAEETLRRAELWKGGRL